MSPEQREALEMQVIVIKREVYHLKKLLEQCTNKEQREESIRLTAIAYEEFDKVQEFIRSR